MTCHSSQYLSAKEVTYKAVSKTSISICCEGAGTTNGRQFFQSIGCGTTVSGTVTWEGYQGGSVVVNPKIKCKTSTASETDYNWYHSPELKTLELPSPKSVIELINPKLAIL